MGGGEGGSPPPPLHIPRIFEPVLSVRASGTRKERCAAQHIPSRVRKGTPATSSFPCFAASHTRTPRAGVHTVGRN